MKKTACFVVTILTLASAPALIQADATTSSPSTKKTWAEKHPRRSEVNHREKKQVKNTHKDVKEGKLTKEQGQELNKEDRQIRQEERDMASQNGGHITKQEQQTLNAQEDAIRKERAADIKSNASNTAVK